MINIINRKFKGHLTIGDTTAVVGSSDRQLKVPKALLVAVLISISITGCKKLVEVNSPVTSTSANLVFSSDATAAAVLTGIYANMSRPGINDISAGPRSLSYFGALSSDEMKLYPLAISRDVLYYTNALSAVTINDGFWESFYPQIFIANSAIEGLNKATGLTSTVKSQLLGEAKFLRAFFYFYLVNLYGDVPLVVSTDYQVNSKMPRTLKTEVWAQITADLKDAQGLLSDNYLSGDIYSTTGDRVRPTKWAASALLSRAYLYQQKWTEAQTAATTVIANTAMYDTVSLNDVFLGNSKEAIWQLQPVNVGWNTEDAKLFIIPSTGPSGDNPVYLSNFLLNSFENGDNRKTSWIDSVIVGGTTYYYPYKYKSATLNDPVSEYQMVLRLGEVYLNRAEARAQQNNLAGAIADLDVIRKRAGLPLIANTNPGISQSALIDKILHERQVELFSEWGHRWLDLKRTGIVDAVMSVVTSQKGGTWNTAWQWYPISQDQLNKNPFLKQNDGY